MGFIVGLLTFVLVLDCVFLILLVLIQLPKKEAGAGLAFGGAASDALFGAGSGTVLTKITKYAAGIFFGLALLLAIMQKNRSTSEFQNQLAQPGRPRPAAMPPAQAQPSAAATAQPGVTNLLMTQPEATNLPTPPAPSASSPVTPAPTTPAPTAAAPGTNTPAPK